MAQVTAMQELIEVLQGNLRAMPDKAVFTHIKTGLRNAILCAKDRLEKERDQIIEAYQDGCVDHDNDTMVGGKNYYNNHYKQQP